VPAGFGGSLVEQPVIISEETISAAVAPTNRPGAARPVRVVLVTIEVPLK
jgi:hypothetical protein